MANVLLDALRRIAENGPTTEPDAEDYDDMESASTQGVAVGLWDAACIARGALAQAEADLVAQAIVKLQEARDLLKQAGALKTVARVRLALSSAKGAQRNVDARLP